MPGLLGARAPNGSGAGIAVASVFILLLGAVAAAGHAVRQWRRHRQQAGSGLAVG